MPDIAPLTVPTSLTGPAGPTSAAELAKRGKIHQTARDFES